MPGEAELLTCACPLTAFGPLSTVFKAHPACYQFCNPALWVQSERWVKTTMAELASSKSPSRLAVIQIHSVLSLPQFDASGRLSL